MNFRHYISLSSTYAASLLFVLVLSVVCEAQIPGSSPQPTPQATPTPSLEKKFFNNILSDQKAIWTFPFHVDRDDSKWLIPLGISTAGLLATDIKTARSLDYDPERLNTSRNISYLGSSYGATAIAGTFYLIGRTTGNARARETGLLGGEALIDSWIVVTALKGVSQRKRPLSGGDAGEFWDGGQSFPSGHAITAWTLATVVANEYRDHRAVQITAYGLASLVSIARFTGQYHFLSDALVGSALGYGIGQYVYFRHHDSALDSNGQTTRHAHSKLIPLVTPVYERTARTYGGALLWSF
jgi:membrane-associated phospholipid phosphatase